MDKVALTQELRTLVDRLEELDTEIDQRLAESKGSNVNLQVIARGEVLERMTQVLKTLWP